MELDFEDPDIAGKLESMTTEELDKLPFGVVRLDSSGEIEVYNKAEAFLSGYHKEAVGRRWFEDVAPCLSDGEFRHQFDNAVAFGNLSAQVEYTGDFNDPERDVEARIMSAVVRGHVWCVLRRI